MENGQIYTEIKNYIKFFDENSRNLNTNDFFSIDKKEEKKFNEIFEKKIELKNILRQIILGIKIFFIIKVMENFNVKFFVNF